MATIKTRITLAEVAKYLDNGARLTDIKDLIDMLKDQENLIQDNINGWQSLIPVVPEDCDWGDRGRCKNLRIVATFLYRQGYTIGSPQLWLDGDSAEWEIIKGDRSAELTYTTATGYTINGAAINIDGL